MGEVTPQEIVARAYDLLGEFGWCRGNYAVNAAGETVPVKSPEMVAMCAVGALQRASLDLGVVTWVDGNLFGEACDMISETVGESITYWNDHQAHDKIDVLETFRETAGVPLIIWDDELIEV